MVPEMPPLQSLDGRKAPDILRGHGYDQLVDDSLEPERKLRRSSPKQVKRAKRMRKKMTPPEVLLWVRLRPGVMKEFNFRRQAPLLGKYVVDFYVSKSGRRIVFEVDGQIHILHEEADALRDAELKAAGIHVVRISARSVFSDPDRVAEFIRMICMGEVDIKDIE